MTPEAAQNLKAYFPDIFKDDDESNQSNDMKEQKLREAIRTQIKKELQEYGTDSDPGRAAASSGGTSTEWFQVARLFSDVAREYPEVKDVGQKEIGGETVHEIAINDRVYQIRKLQ